MPIASDRSSRRDFVADVGRLASAAALTACAKPPVARGRTEPALSSATGGEWDMSWINRLAPATDRAVFDWPTLGDPADPIVLELAARYLDNCDSVYGSHRHDARVVLNIRTTAVPAALTDAAWERYALGVEYKIKDPETQQPAVRNPFWRQPAGGAAAIVMPSLEDFVRRGAILLVCDFALGHLSNRLAAKANRPAEEVHRELRAAFVPTAIAMPSGIFGLARAQNAGCALVRL
jgi:hypothetical protein